MIVILTMLVALPQLRGLQLGLGRLQLAELLLVVLVGADLVVSFGLTTITSIIRTM